MLGSIFIDGSIRRPKCPVRARAGFSCVQVDERVAFNAGLFGPFALVEPDSGKAETMALLLVLTHSLPPIVVYTDCAFLDWGLRLERFG